MPINLDSLLDAMESECADAPIWGHVFESQSVKGNIAIRYYWAALHDSDPPTQLSEFVENPYTEVLSTPRRIARTPKVVTPDEFKTIVLAIPTVHLPELRNFYETFEDFRDLTADILFKVLSTMFGPDEADARHLIVSYNKALLENIFREGGVFNGFNLAAIAVYEIVNHFTRYVVTKGKDPALFRSFTEHLVHPSIDCYLGLAVLSQFCPNKTEIGKGINLAKTIGRILKKQFRNESQRSLLIARRMDLEFNEFQSFIDDELSDDKASRFIYDAWITAALFHDVGYSVATLWDLHNLFTMVDATSWKPEFHILETAAGLRMLNLLDSGVPQDIAELEGLSDFVTNDHLKEIVVCLRDLLVGPSRGDYDSYLKNRKQLHPFWSTFEILSRLKKYDKQLSRRQKLLLYVVLDAIYPHQFSSSHERHGESRNRLASIEAKKGNQDLVFRKNPLAFFLYVIDNCQNFSRVKFGRDDATSKRRPRALTIPIDEIRLQVRLNKDGKFKELDDFGCLTISLGGLDHDPNHVEISGVRERIDLSNAAEISYLQNNPTDRFPFLVLLNRGEKKKELIATP